ncbi:hypothetical protein [Streptomyces sp. NPDC048638]|uniref:hypothetical protein n=1 Tax=Streptomyces sp. NPDC048638 TaxID=3365580 RepID=UPI003724C108
MRPSIRRAATVAAAASVLAGGIAALAASPASAAGSCTRNDRDHTIYAPNLSWPAVHTGPGASYKVTAHVDSAGKFRVKCSALSKAGNRFYYGYVEEGTYAGKTGWVYSGNF